MPKSVSLEELYRPILAELAHVRNEVKHLLSDIVGIVGESGAEQFPFNGGKLLRPALCLLSAGACGTRDIQRFVPLATAMEVMHVAALAHDDVVDGATLRRGGSSLNAMWDDRAAVLGGDYLVARGLTLMMPYQNCAIIEDTINAVRLMTEGELYSYGHRHERGTPDQSIDLARKKTATLFALSCAAPARLIENAPHTPLHEYGIGLGVAFQLVDDLLDLSQDEETLGKPTCGDIVEGKKTLPILFMRQALGEPEVARLDAMAGATLTAADREWVSDILERSGARAQAESVARRYVDEALKAIRTLPVGSEYKESMEGLAEFVLIRGS